MTPPPDILPLERESRKAYEARRHYLLSGNDRSLTRTARETGVALSEVKRLSTKWNWLKLAADLDHAAAKEAAEAAWASYQEQVERHKQLCIAMGQSLIVEGREMLAQFSTQRREGMRYTPTALNTIMRAFQIGAELQAHGLGLDGVPPATEDPAESAEQLQIEYVNDWREQPVFNHDRVVEAIAAPRIVTYDYAAAARQLGADPSTLNDD